MSSNIKACGKCRKPHIYPFFKVPLGPVSYDPKGREEDIKKNNIDITAGYVVYSWYCLPCTRDYVASLTEDDLKSK